MQRGRASGSLGSGSRQSRVGLVRGRLKWAGVGRLSVLLVGEKIGMGWLGLMVDGRGEVMDQGIMAGAVGDLLASTVAKMSLKFKNGLVF